MIRAAALLGPGVSEKELAPFHLPDVEITLMQDFVPPVGVDAVLVLGGDGTMHRYLRAFVDEQVPVLLAPRGSGNDFARSLGIATMDEAYRAWSTFVARSVNVFPVDLGVISGLRSSADAKPTYFCCVGGVGLDAEANKRANAMPRTLKGLGGYALAALTAAASYKPRHMQVLAASNARPSDWKSRVAQPAMLVAFANASQYGGGFRIAPMAKVDDGLLDVCFVRQTSLPRLLTLMPKVFAGKHTESKEVDYFQTEMLRIVTESPMDVYADGEYVCATPITVTMAPRALKVLRP
jgi:diacylglycerol kinase (ATP)